MTRWLGAVLLNIAFIGNAAAADYRLTLTEFGKRDYYCTITVTLENLSEQPLVEINGFFLSFVGDEEVGRSKGASFLDVAPGESTTAEFETPNAPCTDAASAVTGYRFFVGACRVGQSFMDRDACADRIESIAPILSTAGR